MIESAVLMQNAARSSYFAVFGGTCEIESSKTSPSKKSRTEEPVRGQKHDQDYRSMKVAGLGFRVRESL